VPQFTNDKIGFYALSGFEPLSAFASLFPLRQLAEG
jgi:hypothetical protein